MIGSLFFALLSTLVAASPAPQSQPVPGPGFCCFTLQDTATGATLQQNERGGYVYLNGGFPNGWYCIEPASQRNLLWDLNMNTCYIDPSQQFDCLDPTPSGDKWTLVKNNSSKLLARNNDVAFWACPAKTGGEFVFVPQKASKTGCRKINLKATGFKGAC